MRRYRSHHPHRSCGWLRQAKAAESLIAVLAFYIERHSSQDGLRDMSAEARRAKAEAIPINCDAGRWVSQRARPVLRTANCFASRASEISHPRRDKSTRRANHQNLSSPLAKNILLFRNRKSVYVKTVSPDERGGSRSSRTCGGMRWTRWRRMTSAARGGRRRRVVLTPRGWCQIRGKQNFARMTVARKPGHRGEHAISRKATAQGRPDCLR